MSLSDWPRLDDLARWSSWNRRRDGWMGELTTCVRTLITDLDTAEASLAAAESDIDDLEAQWAPVAFTPTLASGGTIGNGTVTGEYVQTNKVLHWWINWVLGSTSTMGTNPKFDVPGSFTLDGASGLFRMPGTAVALDNGTGFHAGACYAGDSGDDILTTRIIFGSTTVTATAPFTWTTNDALWLSGTMLIV